MKLFFTLIVCATAASGLNATELVCRLVDSKTGRPLAARVYIENNRGEWFFVQSTGAAGTAVRYDKTNWMQKESFEKHTTVSAHPFRADLPPGDYTITVERG